MNERRIPPEMYADARAGARMLGLFIIWTAGAIISCAAGLAFLLLHP